MPGDRNSMLPLGSCKNVKIASWPSVSGANVDNTQGFGANVDARNDMARMRIFMKQHHRSLPGCGFFACPFQDVFRLSIFVCRGAAQIDGSDIAGESFSCWPW